MTRAIVRFFTPHTVAANASFLFPACAVEAAPAPTATLLHIATATSVPARLNQNEVPRELHVAQPSWPSGSYLQPMATVHLRDWVERMRYEAVTSEFPFSREEARLMAPGEGNKAIAISSTRRGGMVAQLALGGLEHPEQLTEEEPGGAVILIERGEQYFCEEMNNAADTGPLGVVSSDRTGGELNRTAENALLPTVTMSQEGGAVAQNWTGRPRAYPGGVEHRASGHPGHTSFKGTSNSQPSSSWRRQERGAGTASHSE